MRQAAAAPAALLAVLLALLAGLAGCRPAPEAAQWPAPAPALWEARAPNGAKAWLFGTMHALPDEVAWQTPALEAAIAQADVLMVEIADLDDGEAAARAFSARAAAPGLAPLGRRVPAAGRPALQAALERAGIDAAAFATTETWAAALQLGNALRCGDAGNGADRTLLARMGRVEPLESFARQFDLFDSLSDMAQADLLLGVVAEEGCAANAARVRAWLRGDLAALAQQVERGFRGNGELRAVLLDGRNRHFATRLARRQAQAPEEEVLLAVGAAHLVGPQGVPALLEQGGYRLRRIQ